MQGWICHRRLAWQILKLSRVRRGIPAHEDTTSPPAMIAVVLPLPPLPPNLCPRGISSPSSVVVFAVFPPPTLSPHLMLIVKSHLLQHQRASLHLTLARCVAWPVLSSPSLASCRCSCVASHLVSSRCIPSPISSPHIALSLIVASSSLPIAPRLVVVFIVVIASLTSRHVALSPLAFLSLRCVSLSRRVVILARLVVAVLRIVSS